MISKLRTCISVTLLTDSRTIPTNGNAFDKKRNYVFQEPIKIGTLIRLGSQKMMSMM